MPEPTITDKIDAVRRLLREGRTTEADRDLDTLEKAIHDEEQRRIMEIPPPGPRTLNQLTVAFYETVADLFGNNPRLLALIVEIKAKLEDEE
jgi:hypothetical protein